MKVATKLLEVTLSEAAFNADLGESSNYSYGNYER